MPGNPIVGMRLEADIIARLDRLAEAHGLSRGQLIRAALERLPDWPSATPAAQLPGQMAVEDVQSTQK